MKTLSSIICSITLLLITSCTFHEHEYSPYIHSVFEYVYGVGQHAQSVSYDTGEHLKGQNANYVLLGGWGGYIVAGFDHNVKNRQDFYDLAIFSQNGVGNEPAVIFVMKDTNENKIPDDIWYEIGGSETGKEGYQREAKVTYYKEENLSLPMFYTMQGDKDTKHYLINGYGENASSTWWWPLYDVLDANEYHAINIGEDDLGSFITFTGTLLPHSKEFINGQWSDISQKFTFGYGENYSGDDYKFVPFGKGIRGANLIDISDAIDSDGNPVNLEFINFIKIQTGVLQVCGQMNEVSSEIAGAADLHLLQGDWRK